MNEIDETWKECVRLCIKNGSTTIDEVREKLAKFYPEFDSGVLVMDEIKYIRDKLPSTTPRVKQQSDPRPDPRPYRKHSDPSSSHAAAVGVVEREGGKGTIRKNSHKHILLEVFDQYDRPTGLTLQEAAQLALDTAPTSFTGQIPKRDAARRAEEIAKMGLLDKLPNGSHYRINKKGEDIRKRLVTAKQIVVT